MEEVKTTTKYVEEFFELRKKKEGLEIKLSELNAQIDLVERKLVEILNEAGVEKLSSKDGTVWVQKKWSVKVPHEPKDKKMLFEWLIKNGLFDRYTTVNSVALNALYMKEWEEAQSEGKEDFSIPGIEQPKMYEKLGRRKK